MKKDIIKILKSWREKDSKLNSTESLLAWIKKLNETNVVNITKSIMRPDEYWLYNSDKGIIENKNKRFFSIRGLQYKRKGEVLAEQPIIYQMEIGFLGIICKEFDGVMHFLMQAKVEPGNVNCVQISPTIQATKSNFEQAHGGTVPNYFSYFQNSKEHTIIFDQVQSEQGTRFYKKRNRNIMIRVDEDIEVLPAFRWMTLGQIKELMKIDNLVNMDTRTVLSCIPLSTYHYDEKELKEIEECFGKKELFASIFQTNIQDDIVSVYNHLNDVKMFLDTKAKLVPLTALKDWNVDETGVHCRKEACFDVEYFDIEISGREVRNWKQPLLCARGIGTFGLFVCRHEGVTKFLVSIKTEIGAFDSVEIGPTIFMEAVNMEKTNYITEMFFDQMNKGEGVINDGLFSEEGGRFYHEQNRNVILLTDYIPPEKLPKGYFWMSYSSLNSLVQINNCLNIQLRNLLSIIDIV